MKKILSLLLTFVIITGTVALLPVSADESAAWQESSETAPDISASDPTGSSADITEATESTEPSTAPAAPAHSYDPINKSVSGTVSNNKKVNRYYMLSDTASYQFYFKHTGSNCPHLGLSVYSIGANGDEARVYHKTIIFDEVNSVSSILKLSAGEYRVCIDNTVDVLPVTAKYALKLTKYTRTPTAIKLSQKTATLKYGKTKKLTPYDSDNSYISTSVVKFSSSNKKVATVSAKGTVTAKWQGKATITCKIANGKTAKIKITVPKLTLSQKISSCTVTTSVNYVYTSGKNALVGLYVKNNSNKKIKRVYMDFAEYNKKGKLMKGTYDNYYTVEPLPKKSSLLYNFYLQKKCYKARGCIKYVVFTDKKKWTNPYYKEWRKTYKKK